MTNQSEIARIAAAMDPDELRKAAAVELVIQMACHETTRRHGRTQAIDDIAWEAGYRAAQLTSLADFPDNLEAVRALLEQEQLNG